MKVEKKDDGIKYINLTDKIDAIEKKYPELSEILQNIIFGLNESSENHYRRDMTTLKLIKNIVDSFTKDIIVLREEVNGLISAMNMMLDGTEKSDKH
jgi:hypothetical protein